MIESLDDLPVVKTFKSLRPLMANQRVKTKLRLLCTFGFNGSDVIFATNEDKVYGLGRNERGCLGLGVDTLNISPPKLNTYLTDKGLANIWWGFGHCVGLTSDGQCWSWGDNKYGSLGNGTCDDSSVPQRVHGLDDKHVVSVSCGNSHTLVLASDGLVYGFGRNLFGQLGDESYVSRVYATPVALTGCQVVSISTGRNHSLAVTDTGRVYVWGLNIRGQLGRHKDEDVSPGQLMPTCETPKPVKLANDVVVKKAVCGSDCTLLLTTDGLVYTFGDGSHDQIGHGLRTNQYTPYCIPINVRFKDIISTTILSVVIAVTMDDRYYVWGVPYRSSPVITKELMTTHSVYDIYAIYTGIGVTFETIIFNKPFNTISNTNTGCDLQCQQNIDNKVIDGFKDMNIRCNESVSDCDLKELDSNEDNCNTFNSNEDLIAMTIFGQCLASVFNNQLDSDLVFVFKDNKIYCHKIVLKLRNKQFWHKCQQLLSESKSINNEIQVKSFSYECMKAFLEFLYAMKPEITSKKVCKEVSKLATIYGETILQEICNQVINELDDEEVVIDLSNICQMYEKAINEKITDLEINCIEFVSNNLVVFFKSNAFRQMPEYLSKRLMKSVYE